MATLCWIYSCKTTTYNNVKLNKFEWIVLCKIKYNVSFCDIDWKYTQDLGCDNILNENML